MRNILLFVDDIKEAKTLAAKALKVALQCKANLHLCNAAQTVTGGKLFFQYNDDDILLDDSEAFDINELAHELTGIEYPEGTFVPAINSLEINGFNSQKIGEAVVEHNIWLIVMDEQQLHRLNNKETACDALNVINESNCPVLILPQQMDFAFFNRISYITDLRYCDLGVMQFLKVFNAQVFVTHISAPGLPDMEERYAQELLAEEISARISYSKIFLRNIKNHSIKESINHIVDTLDIKILAFVSKKHQTFERLFNDFSDKSQLYQNVPVLIFPYLNWFHKASFYS